VKISVLRPSPPGQSVHDNPPFTPAQTAGGGGCILPAIQRKIASSTISVDGAFLATLSPKDRVVQ
jgi:hypothetical protein